MTVADNTLKLNVGTNFDPALLDGLVQLNERGGVARVTELFGSLPGVNPIGTARPAFRLRDGTLDTLREHVTTARAHGMTLNYTVNVSVVDPRMLHERDVLIRTFLDDLQDIGVGRVIVAHPLVAQVIAERAPALPIELSTIMQIRHPRQLTLLKARCPSIDKLCLDVYANRNAVLLAELRDASRDLGIKLEALANEFCVYECPDRNACYDLHALDMTPDDVKLFGHYPMGQCIRTRIMDPREWLHARFILPQWMRFYADRYNVATFKVSGRTHPTAYILSVAAAYVAGLFDGNLLTLWADVENIGRAEAAYRAPRVHIDSGMLTEAEFLRPYFERVMTQTAVNAHIAQWYARATTLSGAQS